MKRHNQPDEGETSESLHQSKVRRTSPAGRRVSDEEGSVDLDLNATPLGFDLNAPVVEEEPLQSNSDWVSVHQDVESMPDIAEAVRLNPIPSEVTSLDHTKVEDVPIVGQDNVQLVIKSEEGFEPGQPIPGDDSVDRSPEEEDGSDQGESRSVKAEEVEDLEEKPPVVVPAVFSRSFEPVSIHLKNVVF